MSVSHDRNFVDLTASDVWSRSIEIARNPSFSKFALSPSVAWNKYCTGYISVRRVFSDNVGVQS